MGKEISQKDWADLKRAGIVPDGATPWDQVALREAVGKRLARKTVLPALYTQLDRLSDTDSAENPEEYARKLINSEEILGPEGTKMSLYARASFEGELEPILNQFNARVSEVKQARIAKKNRDNLVDDLYDIATKHTKGVSSQETAVNISDKLKETYTLHGISGREEAWTAISEAAKELARDGDYELSLIHI